MYKETCKTTKFIDFKIQKYIVLQLTASPWSTEASTSEKLQFGALTNRKASSSNRASSLSSLYYYWVRLSLYRDKRITIIRLWWLSQWLVTHGHHLAVKIYLHVAPSSGRHNSLSMTIQYHPDTLILFLKLLWHATVSWEIQMCAVTSHPTGFPQEWHSSGQACIFDICTKSQSLCSL